MRLTKYALVLTFSAVSSTLSGASLGMKLDPQLSSGCFTCYNSRTPFDYTPRRGPSLCYADVVNNTARCARIVNANSQPVRQNSTGCWSSAVQNNDVLINDEILANLSGGHRW